jgi:hypothetical protein
MHAYSQQFFGLYIFFFFYPLSSFLISSESVVNASIANTILLQCKDLIVIQCAIHIVKGCVDW